MKTSTNSSQIFSLALGLEEPWFVEEVNLENSENTSTSKLHIHINFRKGHEFVSEAGQTGKGYDTEEKVWRHLNFFQHECYLHARVPRIKQQDGKIRQITIPFRGHAQVRDLHYCLRLMACF
jgi:transposase